MLTLSRGTMFVNSDFTDLLRLFNGNGVRYLVIGVRQGVKAAETRDNLPPPAQGSNTIALLCPAICVVI